MQNMEYRRLKPEEQVQMLAISQTVFLTSTRHDIREMLKNPIEHAKDDDIVRLGAFDEKERMLSALQVHPYIINMNGKQVKMGGIGSVLTRPEARHGGNVRKLMDIAFDEMEMLGHVFSFLYPFSFEYYRKFGYEMCYQYNSVSIPFSQLKDYPVPINVTHYELGDSIAPYCEIYETFAHNRNLSILRSKSDWVKLLDRDPYKNLQFTYLFDDAYILYEAVNPSTEGTTLLINELCWRTPKGLYEAFGFLYKLGVEYSTITWNIPNDINIYALFPDTYDLTWQRQPVGMVALVNIQEALLTLHPPNGSGEITLNIIDTFRPKNSGAYFIEWANKTLHVEKVKETAEIITMTSATLAQLITGYLSLGAALYKRDVIVHRADLFSQLDNIFPKRLSYICERF